MDEMACNMFSQALRPTTALVHGMQQLGGATTKMDEDPSSHGLDVALGQRIVAICFDDLRAVHATDAGAVLQFEDIQGGIVTVPLFSVPFGEAVREALVVGVQTALARRDRRACWEKLRTALHAEQHIRQYQQRQPQDTQRLGSGSGERMLEVFEVERWNFAAGKYETPFLSVDRGLSWRWVDATGCKHPHIIRSYTRSEVASKSTPPCTLDTLFRSSSEWKLDINGNTDDAGWRYGLAWNSSTWGPTPQ